MNRPPLAPPDGNEMQACSLESIMARVPSDAWLLAALGSIGLSLFLKLNGRRDDSRFIGDWAAPFLLLGVYTKLSTMTPANNRGPNPPE